MWQGLFKWVWTTAKKAAGKDSSSNRTRRDMSNDATIKPKSWNTSNRKKFSRMITSSTSRKRWRRSITATGRRWRRIEPAWVVAILEKLAQEAVSTEDIKNESSTQGYVDQNWIFLHRIVNGHWTFNLFVRLSAWWSVVDRFHWGARSPTVGLQYDWKEANGVLRIQARSRTERQLDLQKKKKHAPPWKCATTRSVLFSSWWTFQTRRV